MISTNRPDSPPLSSRSCTSRQRRGATTRIWGASRGGHLARIARQGAADGAKAHLYPQAEGLPAAPHGTREQHSACGRSWPLTRRPTPGSRTAAVPAPRRRLRRLLRPDASSQSQRRAARRGGRKRSLRKALPGDWLKAAPIPRSPDWAGPRAERSVSAPLRARCG